MVVVVVVVVVVVTYRRCLLFLPWIASIRHTFHHHKCGTGRWCLDFYCRYTVNQLANVTFFIGFVCARGRHHFSFRRPFGGEVVTVVQVVGWVGVGLCTV